MKRKILKLPYSTTPTVIAVTLPFSSKGNLHTPNAGVFRQIERDYNAVASHQVQCVHAMPAGYTCSHKWYAAAAGIDQGLQVLPY